MKAEKNKLPRRSQSSVGGIVLFLLAAALCLYFLVPTTATLIDRNVTNGAIQHHTNQSVVVAFVDTVDGKTCYLQRKLDSRFAVYLQRNSQTIQVIYSRYFPENGWLPEVEKDHAGFAAGSVLVILLTAFWVIKEDLATHFR
jgi:hypothetical protein